MNNPLLSLQDCSIFFGGLGAVQNLNFELAAGELVGIIGPNGAGKTTVFNLITGIYHPTSGTISFDHTRINNLQPYAINRLGIARTFQNIRLFSGLTVLENVLTAFQAGLEAKLFSTVLRNRAFCQEREKLYQQAFELLKLVEIGSLSNQPATSLSYGDQRRLELARALATRPKLLLLDEPAAGMNPAEKNKLRLLIESIHRKQSLTILLIDHDMSFMMRICQRIAVLDEGKKIAEGPPSAIQENQLVIEAYLGQGEDEIFLHHPLRQKTGPGDE